MTPATVGKQLTTSHWNGAKWTLTSIMRHSQEEPKQYHDAHTAQASYIHQQPVPINPFRAIPEVGDQCAGHSKQESSQVQCVASSIATKGILAPLLPIVNSLTYVQPVLVVTLRAVVLIQVPTCS